MQIKNLSKFVSLTGMKIKQGFKKFQSNKKTAAYCFCCLESFNSNTRERAGVITVRISVSLLFSLPHLLLNTADQLN